MNADVASRLVCAGCGWAAPEDLAYPFRCPNADRNDDVDHVIHRALDLTALSFPRGGAANPFIRYRALTHAYHVARAGGMSDEDFQHLVTELDVAVAQVDGHGFTATPFARAESLSARLGFGGKGAVWIKDETGNVSGSHKARHLMGVAIYLEVIERLGRAPGRPRLAIASCGNAALAAAVVARAAQRPLDVFVPPDAGAPVIERLQALGANIQVCPRQPGTHGDPCMSGFRTALAAGALPFSCQGSENGLAIEGGQTLAYEMIATLADERVAIDRLFVQVGGGALASACIHALREARALGVIERLPRIHAVQTEAAHPLVRAYQRAAAHFGEDPSPARASQVMREAATHRSHYMWPWEEPPQSIARGILDDETYDWLVVVAGMIETGGYPLLASEAVLAEANELARAETGLTPCFTGTAGLAGLLELAESGALDPEENVAVLLTGAARD